MAWTHSSCPIPGVLGRRRLLLTGNRTRRGNFVLTRLALPLISGFPLLPSCLSPGIKSPCRRVAESTHPRRSV